MPVNTDCIWTVDDITELCCLILMRQHSSKFTLDAFYMWNRLNRTYATDLRNCIFWHTLGMVQFKNLLYIWPRTAHQPIHSQWQTRPKSSSWEKPVKSCERLIATPWNTTFCQSNPICLPTCTTYKIYIINTLLWLLFSYFFKPILTFWEMMYFCFSSCQSVDARIKRQNPCLVHWLTVHCSLSFIEQLKLTFTFFSCKVKLKYFLYLCSWN